MADKDNTNKEPSHELNFALRKVNSSKAKDELRNMMSSTPKQESSEQNDKKEEQ